MSRSYKRYAVCKDKNSRYGKRMSASAVRRSRETINGGAYKKLYCSWNICDYRFYEGSFEHSIEDWRKIWESTPRLQKRFPTWKTAYRYWLKCYKNK